MNFPFIEYQTFDDIAVLSLNDPPANTLTYDLMAQLEDACMKAMVDPQIRAIVLTGAGERFFSGGVNIGMLSNVTHHYNSNFLVYAAEVFERIVQSPLLVVAAINGHITGGGLELALTADRRVAVAGSYNIGFPEVRLGVIPGLGGTQRLTKIIGNCMAVDLITQGRFISVDEAAALGIVDEVLPTEDFLQNAIAYTRNLLKERNAARGSLTAGTPWQPSERTLVTYTQTDGVGVIKATEACASVSALQALWALNQSILDARLDERMKVLILTHEGTELRLGTDEQHDAMTFEYADFVFRRLENLPKLCILAFSGSLTALETELALACDYRFAPEPGVGRDGRSIAVSASSPRLAGYRLQDRCYDTSGVLSMLVAQAVSLGIVKYVETAEWIRWVINWSRRFLPPSGASMSVGYAKLAIVKGSSFPVEAGMLLERHLQEQLFKSHDGPEGMKAYLAKRSAAFIGA